MHDYQLPQYFKKILGDLPDEWVLEAIKKGLFTKDEIHGM